MVIGLGFSGGVESMVEFWWWITVMGLGDGWSR